MAPDAIATAVRSYDVREFRPGDESSILALFNDVFGEESADFEPRTPDQWRWLFADNPQGRQIVVAAEPTGRVIAQFASLPVRAQVAGEIVLAAQGVDSMAHRDCRRGLRKRSAFLRAALAYCERFARWPVCGFGYGFPNPTAYRIGQRFIGYVPVVRPFPTLYRNFFEHPDDDEVGLAHAGSADVVEIAEFGQEMDELWARLRGRFAFALLRDRQYLHWRYDCCPWLGYRKFLIRERDAGALRGFFVVRSGWQHRPIEALVDFLADPDDEASLALALRTTTSLGRAARQARVEAWFPERSPYFAAALRAGFRTEPSPCVLVLKLYRDWPTLDWVRDHWYFTIGDSDVF